MAGKNGKNARNGHQGQPGPDRADWDITLKNGTPLHVSDAEMRRTPESYVGSSAERGYQFTRDGKLVAETAPGEVSHIVRREPEVKHLLLPASLSTISPSQLRDFQAALSKALAGTDVARLGILPAGSEVAGHEKATAK